MPRKKLITKEMPPGNPNFRRVAELERRVDGHDARFDATDSRMDAFERELRGLNSDIAVLANVAYRASTRRQRLLAMRLRRSKSARR